jgi:hypothetical protein
MAKSKPEKKNYECADCYYHFLLAGTAPHCGYEAVSHYRAGNVPACHNLKINN